MENKQFSPKRRAGVVPAKKIDGTWHYLFMIPSDPNYGGDRPQIAKGRVEDYETDVLATALREGFEELGLLEHNIEAVHGPFEGQMEGLDSVFNITAYAAIVKDQNDFGQFHYETGSTHWMTLAKAQKAMRRSQLALFLTIAEHVEKL